jgi:hypothetical protein
MQKATEKILAVTTDAQKVVAIGQLDASNKRLRALRQEYEKVAAQLSGPGASRGSMADSDNDNAVFSAQEAQLKKDLEDQLEDDTKKRAALSKVIQQEKRRSRDMLNMSNGAKDIDLELIATERSIAKTKENLEILASNDRKRIRTLVNLMLESSKKLDNKGHFFAARQFFKPTDCAVCHDTLFDTKNQGMECSSNLF